MRSIPFGHREIVRLSYRLMPRRWRLVNPRPRKRFTQQAMAFLAGLFGRSDPRRM